MHEDSGRTFTRDPWRAPDPGSSPGLTAQPEWAAARRLSTARPSGKGGSSLLDKTLELLQIRREEAPLALLVTLYFFLALASVSMIKSVQNAFYLGRVGFDWRLPSLYVVLALISGLGVVFYRRLSHRFSRVAINGATLVALILSLVGAVVAEYVGANRGLGALIIVAQGTLDTELMFVAFVVLTALGFTLDKIHGLVYRLVLRRLYGRSVAAEATGTAARPSV